MNHSIDIEKTKIFLFELLKQEVETKSMEWLVLQKEKIEKDGSYLKFYMAFGQASRFFKKTILQLTDQQKKLANSIREGFSPHTWDQLQTARGYLLLHFEEKEASSWVNALNKLFETADMHEQQSLYAALPIMPFQPEMIERAIEGLRTNISSVFDAVALNNPYPSEYFDERAWNQMVLKAIFMQRPLYQIQNADSRANPVLAKILVDFAHERWAAGRTVMPELWRFVGPYVNEENFADIQKVLQTNDPNQKKAALLACGSSDYVPAKKLLEDHSEINKAIINGEITWEHIGVEFQSSI
ncbi:hypothetical protein SAMN00777080_0102 [Aquiflexum balticum DSM 16537]|uniref:Uncharacterized protein n=1 Tax=Aquiflexum balticum DSM 16537 TaxID=758820 RepID=A0A1W2GXZ4_9BACT|nr:EboA domain-containing protein [Aquiflexum balticum]SMD41577.1 hypothetical protein SAMN00777080_0102 [Aquiflexum balticum DSM 16537]